MYTVKGIKAFEGMEGPGFNADLYRDGTRVAHVRDMGNGGPMDFEWEAMGEEARLREYAKTLPPLVVPNCPRPLNMTPDLVVARLVDEAETAARNARRNRQAKKA